MRSFIDSLVSLQGEEMEALQGILTHKTLKKKEYFLRQGQVCRQLGLIVKGYVRLFYQVDGEEITKDFNFENWICGSYASFSLQQPSRFNIVAMEDTELYLLGRDELYRLFDSYPNIQKLGRLQIEKMFIRKEQREASFLLDTAEQRYRNLLEQEPQMVRRVPLKYLASYLGMTAETLSRVRRQASLGSKPRSI
ncbi:MAG: cyclic nucleotide binding regulatory protein [Chitinophagaceae bacterium]|nr:cyclic nucleotide binding regulatory protein [Chitinophagaceae bacterium]